MVQRGLKINKWWVIHSYTLSVDLLRLSNSATLMEVMTSMAKFQKFFLALLMTKISFKLTHITLSNTLFLTQKKSNFWTKLKKKNTTKQNKHKKKTHQQFLNPAWFVYREIFKTTGAGCRGAKRPLASWRTQWAMQLQLPLVCLFLLWDALWDPPPKKNKKNELFNTCMGAELSRREEMNRLGSTHGGTAPTVIILCGVTEMSDSTADWSKTSPEETESRRICNSTHAAESISAFSLQEVNIYFQRRREPVVWMPH